MPTKFLRRGQAQHLFNDLLPGIILVILGVLLLSYATSSQDNMIHRDVDDRLWENYGERQLLQFLQTRVLHLGTHKEIWQILYEAQDHNLRRDEDPENHGDWIKTPLELSVAGSYDYGILWGDALLCSSLLL